MCLPLSPKIIKIIHFMTINKTIIGGNSVFHSIKIWTLDALKFNPIFKKFHFNPSKISLLFSKRITKYWAIFHSIPWKINSLHKLESWKVQTIYMNGSPDGSTAPALILIFNSSFNSVRRISFDSSMTLLHELSLYCVIPFSMSNSAELIF